MFWSLNNQWQGQSDAAVDYTGRWKLLQHAMARVYAPTLLHLQEGWDTPNNTGWNETNITAGIANDTPKSAVATVTITLRSWALGSALATWNYTGLVPPYSSHNFTKTRRAALLGGRAASSVFLTATAAIHANVHLLDAVNAGVPDDGRDEEGATRAIAKMSGLRIAQAHHYFTKMKVAELHDPLIKLVFNGAAGVDGGVLNLTVTLSCVAPAPNVFLDPGILLGHFDDNGILLLPGEPRTLTFNAMGEADVFAQKCPGFLDAACDAGLGGAACDAPPMLPSPSPLPECFPHCFTEGQPCERTTQCAAGLACVGGACTAGSVEGQSCQASAQCISGLECIGGVCATGGTEAQKCERASECVSGLSCVAGICTAGGFEKGQTCKASAQCVSGLACVDGVCADSESGREGQPCEQPSECVSGLQCTAGVCTPGRLPWETGDVGQSCEASAQCKAGLACVEGKCAAGGSRAEGEKCAESAQCASRLCVDGACASNGPGSSPSAEDNSTGGGGARKDSSWPCEGGACGYGSVNKTHASTTNPLREGADFRPKVQVPVYDGAQLYDSPPPSKPPSPPPPPPPGALGFGSVNKSVFGPTNPLRKLTQVPHYPGGAQQQQQGGLDVASNECDLAFWLCGRRPADYRVGGAHDVSGNSLDAHRHDDASRTDVAVAPLKGNVSVPAHNVPFSSASNASSTLADGTPIAGLEWLVVVFVVALIGCCVAWLWSSMAAKRRDS